MSDKYDKIMLTIDGCPHCADAKDKLKDKIDSGQVKVMNVSNSPDALKLANKYKIDGVPSFIVKNKATNIGEVCDLAKDGSKLYCKDKEVKL